MYLKDILETTTTGDVAQFPHRMDFSDFLKNMDVYGFKTVDRNGKYVYVDDDDEETISENR